MGGPVTVQRWELYAGVLGLLVLGAVLGAPFGAGLYRALVVPSAGVAEVERSLRRMTDTARQRAARENGR